MLPIYVISLGGRTMAADLSSWSTWKEPEVQGVDVLMNVAIALERVNPHDRFCPFCRSLLCVVRPLIEKDLKSRGFDKDDIDAVYQARISSRDVADPPRSVLEEIVRLQSERTG